MSAPRADRGRCCRPRSTQRLCNCSRRIRCRPQTRRPGPLFRPQTRRPGPRFRPRSCSGGTLSRCPQSLPCPQVADCSPDPDREAAGPVHQLLPRARVDNVPGPEAPLVRQHEYPRGPPEAAHSVPSGAATWQRGSSRHPIAEPARALWPDAPSHSQSSAEAASRGCTERTASA